MKNKYIIMVDTCTFMASNSEAYFESIKNNLKREDNYIILQYKVATEINRLLEHDKKETRRKAKIASKFLNRMLEEKVVRIFGSEKDDFADHQFIKVIQMYRSKRNICIITQDSDLAQDIINVKFSNSVHYKTDLQILRLNEKGHLESWVDIKKRQANRGKNKVEANYLKPVSESEKFKIEKVPFKIEGNILNKIEVREKSILYSHKLGTFRLESKIASGGEGTVYETNRDFVCKIYNIDRRTKSRYQKLLLMTSKDIKIKGVCWPIDIVCDANGQFVGYIMQKAAGKELQKSVFIKPLLEKYFPNWKRRDLVELCKNILITIHELNRRNIIIGDINPMNILVKSTSEIYFVDVDSYQIGGYPCEVGTINYTAPEIQRKNFKTFLRTYEHEKFAIATLIFMILMLGKSPYAKQEGGDEVQNMIAADFSYPFGPESNKKAPNGPWKFIWSNLPYKVKGLLYDVFKNQNRKSAEEIIVVMNDYLRMIDEGHVENEIYYSSLKKVNKIKIRCSKCKMIYDENSSFVQKMKSQNKELICSKCKSKY